MVKHIQALDSYKVSKQANQNITMVIIESSLKRLENLMRRCLILMMLVTFPLFTYAETTLTASVDRNKIYEADTLNLVILGEIEMDFSLGGIMNFGRSQLESPNVDALSNDFEILDQKQSYNMQSINGNTTAQVTWSYSLAPKRNGTLTIPSIEYKDAKSNLLTVNVLKGKAPQDQNKPPQVFIEATIDKTSAYVQEQIIYTLRLYSADRLASGELSVPESNNAIIQALGDTKKYFRMAHNRRYEVRERQYLVFPQKSGTLTIDAQSFNGLLIDSQKRQRVRVREFTEPLSLAIKPPPSSFTGKTWLPAASLYLSEKWETDPNNLEVGDSITRTLEMKALGLLDSALPQIATDKIPGLKIYPDMPQVESQQHETGAQSIRLESIALVAVNPAEVSLPEIRIPWWDTINDVERVAVIPAKTFTIRPNPELAQLTQAPQPSLNLINESNVSVEDIKETKPEQLQLESQNTNVQNNHFWYTIIVLILIGWFSSVALLLKFNTKINIVEPKISTQPKLNKLYQNLLDAIKNDNHDMPKLLILWANKFSDVSNLGVTVQSLLDIEKLNKEIYIQAKAYEVTLYAAKADPKRNNAYDKEILIKHIKTLVKEHTKTTSTPPLRPMYP